MTWKPDICLHHFPCDDGFASAWIVKRKWPACECIGVNYGQPFPEIDIRDKRILVADFSYSPKVLGCLMVKGADSIVILDHHKTA